MNIVIIEPLILAIWPIMGLILILKSKNKIFKTISFLPTTLALFHVLFYIYFNNTQCEVGCVFVDFYFSGIIALIIINYIVLTVGLFLSAKINRANINQ